MTKFFYSRWVVRTHVTLVILDKLLQTLGQGQLFGLFNHIRQHDVAND